MRQRLKEAWWVLRNGPATIDIPPGDYRVTSTWYLRGPIVFRSTHPVGRGYQGSDGWVEEQDYEYETP